MEDYFSRVGGVHDYLAGIVDQARKMGYTETMLGRRRYLPDLTLTFGNQPLASYLECTPAQLPGINLSSWLSTEQREAFVQRIASLTPQAPVSTAEISIASSRFKALCPASERRLRWAITDTSFSFFISVARDMRRSRQAAS